MAVVPLGFCPYIDNEPVLRLHHQKDKKAIPKILPVGYQKELQKLFHFFSL